MAVSLDITLSTRYIRKNTNKQQMNYPELLQEIFQEIKPQESPDDPDDVTENYESSFALGKLDASLGVAPRREYQGYKRGYVVALLDKLKIQEKDRDFRSEF